jgi:hypothetical protein
MGSNRLWLAAGLVFAAGCSNGWNGFWLVVFDEVEKVSGDCVQQDTGWYDYYDTGDSIERYEQRSGDEWTLIEVQVRKGIATVDVPQSQGQSFQGEVDGDSLTATRKGQHKEGWTRGPHYSEEVSAWHYGIEISRSGDEASGEIQFVDEYVRNSGTSYEDGYEEDVYEYSCKSRQDFEGGRER